MSTDRLSYQTKLCFRTCKNTFFSGDFFKYSYVKYLDNVAVVIYYPVLNFCVFHHKSSFAVRIVSYNNLQQVLKH